MNFINDLKNKLPTLSSTEKEALLSGTVGFERKIISGSNDWNDFLNKEFNQLTEEENNFINTKVKELCLLIGSGEKDYDLKRLRPEVIQFIKSNGFLGLVIPKSYGGLEFSALAHSNILQIVSTVSSAAAVFIAVPNSLGPGELLLHYGTKEQQDFYLPRLAKGIDIPCFGLTSPVAGSDATSIPDIGIIEKRFIDGKEVLGLSLTFNKRYITLAPIADVVGLAVKVSDPNGLWSNEKDVGLTLVLLSRNTEGLMIGDAHNPLDVPFPNGTLKGNNVFVPLEQIIGGPAYLGKGWKMLVECLSVGRGISLPSMSLGAAKLATSTSIVYSLIRKQFGQSIFDFEGIQEQLAPMICDTVISNAVTEIASLLVDEKEKPSVTSAIAKHHVTESSRRVVQKAMDVHGGKGIILGDKNYLGRLWQGAPIAITVEGANILTRSLMIFGQGSIRSHGYIVDELNLLEQDLTEEVEWKLKKILKKHIKNSVKNGFYSLLHGWTGFIPENTKEHKNIWRLISANSVKLSLITDLTLLTLGGGLKKNEILSGLMGDMLSVVWKKICLMKWWQRQGYNKELYPIIKTSLDWLEYEFYEKYEQVSVAHPNRKVATLMNIIEPLSKKRWVWNSVLCKEVLNTTLKSSIMKNLFSDFSNKNSSNEGHKIINKWEEAVWVRELEFEKLKHVKQNKEFPEVKEKVIGEIRKDVVEFYEVDDKGQQWR